MISCTYGQTRLGRSPFFLFGTALLFVWFCAATGAFSQEPAKASRTETDARVSGMLIFASNESAAESDTNTKKTALDLIEGRLRKVFQFKSYRLLGQHRQDVFKHYESWVVPSPDLFLKVDSRGPAEGGGIKLHLQLWQDKKVLVKTDTVVKTGTPLFIKGPKWRKGRLLFVLQMEDRDSAEDADKKKN